MERQITPGWRKSSYSSGNGGNCLELGTMPGAILIRDTKDNGRGPVLRVSPADWTRLVKSVKG
jgi:hypothetical protein